MLSFISALVLVFFTVVGAGIIVLVVFDISPQSPSPNVIIKTTIETMASGDIIRVQNLGGYLINLNSNDVKVIVNGVESFDYPSNTLFSVGASSKTIESVEDVEIEERIENTAVVFIHAESQDEERQNKIVKSPVGNIKWYLNKVTKEKIVLHSFAHLSSSKSSPEFAMEVIASI